LLGFGFICCWGPVFFGVFSLKSGCDEDDGGGLLDDEHLPQLQTGTWSTISTCSFLHCLQSMLLQVTFAMELTPEQSAIYQVFRTDAGRATSIPSSETLTRFVFSRIRFSQ